MSEKKWGFLVVVGALLVGGVGAFFVASLTAPRGAALAATTIATQPTGLREFPDFTPGGTTGEPQIGFAITSADGDRLRSVTVRINEVAGSTINFADFSALLLLRDTASTASDAIDGPLDAYHGAPGSGPADNESADDSIASAPVTAIGESIALNVGQPAQVAGKAAFPTSMSGRGTHEFLVVVKMAESGSTSKQFTLTLVSATCENSDGTSEVSCGASGVTSVTTETIGGPGWVPFTSSDIVTITRQPRDLGVRGFQTDAGNAAQYVGFALTTTGFDTIAAASVRIDATSGSTITADDITGISFVRDSTNPETDWYDPANPGEQDNILAQYPVASLPSGTLVLGRTITLTVRPAVIAALTNRLPTSMSGRGTDEYFIVVNFGSGATDATDQFTFTFVGAKCRQLDGTLGTCGLNSVTTGTIGPRDTTGPSVSSVTIADGAYGMPLSAEVSATFNERLKNETAADRVTLTALNLCTAVDQSSAATACATKDATNLCTSASESADESGNLARVITCNHAEFTVGSWYEARFLSGASGVEDALRNTMATTRTDRFYVGAGISVDSTPPGNAMNLESAAAASQVTLTWSDPADSDLAFLRVLRAISGSPATILLGTVASGRGRFVDADVAPGTTYVYTVQSVDQTGNRSTGTSAMVAVPLPTPPCTLTADERTRLERKFAISQGRELSPASINDLKFLCALRFDASRFGDPTQEFPPGYVNTEIERRAQQYVTDFFGRVLSAAEQLVAKYMAYRPILLPAARNPKRERECMRLFIKQKGRAPSGTDYNFIRACSEIGSTSGG